MSKQQELVPVKSYSKKELVKMYNTSWKVFKQWEKPFIKELKAIGWRPHQQMYTIKQVELLFNRLGHP